MSGTQKPPGAARPATADALGRPRRYYGNPRRRHWTPERIIEKAQEWNEKYGEPPRSSDWDPHRIDELAERLRDKVREWELRRTTFRIGDYPSRRTVNQVFGSWNEMVSQAGFTPRATGQNTPRGVEASPLLIPISHAVNRVYEAEDLGGHEGLIAALEELEEVAHTLRYKLIENHATNKEGSNGNPGSPRPHAVRV